MNFQRLGATLRICINGCGDIEDKALLDCSISSEAGAREQVRWPRSGCWTVARIWTRRMLCQQTGYAQSDASKRQHGGKVELAVVRQLNGIDVCSTSLFP